MRPYLKKTKKGEEEEGAKQGEVERGKRERDRNKKTVALLSL